MKVLVFGGTHGNEWTGALIATKYAKAYQEKYPKLDIEFVLANPEAFKMNCRFKDEDLNRAFQFLSHNRPTSFENQRAREIQELIQKQECFVIDLHTTTSNMGATVILPHYNPINLSVARKLAQRMPECRIIGSPDPQRKYLASQSDLGMMIEVGPVANGMIEALALERTLKVLDIVLEELPQGNLDDAGEIELFEEIEDISYPLDEKGEIAAYIHPELQGKDFAPLEGRFKAFKTFNGKEVFNEAKEELHPIFINEAAYYPQKLAFTLCRKTKIKIK